MKSKSMRFYLLSVKSILVLVYLFIPIHTAATSSNDQLQISDVTGNTIVFTPSSGMYAGIVTVEMETDVPNGEIRFTTNGHRPSMRAQLYSEGITITATTRIRARVFVDGEPVGPIQFQNYAFPTELIPIPQEIISNAYPLDPDFQGVVDVAPGTGNGFPTVSMDYKGHVSLWGATNVVDVNRSTFSNIDNAIDIAAGIQSVTVLKDDGTITIAANNVPQDFIQMPRTIPDAVAVKSAEFWSAFLLQDGTMVAYGENDPFLNARLEGVADLENVVDFDINATSGIALLEDGSIQTWGTNPPPAPAGLRDIERVYAFPSQFGVLTKNGRLHVWPNRDSVLDEIARDVYGIKEVAVSISSVNVLTTSGRVQVYETISFDLDYLEGNDFTATKLFGGGRNSYILQSTVIRDWSIGIFATDQNSIRNEIFIGTSSQASTDFNIGLDRLAPPRPPEGSFDIRILGDSEDYFGKILPTTFDQNQWNVYVKGSGESSGFVNLKWDAQALGNLPGKLVVEYVDADGVSQSKVMTETDSIDVSSDTVVTIFHLQQLTIERSLDAGWHLVGLPLQAAEITPQQIFRNKTPDTFFGYRQGSYRLESFFDAGTGYWVRLEDSDVMQLGPPFDQEIQSSVDEGWNLISGPSGVIPTADVFAQNPSFIPGTLLGYDDAYFEPDGIRPLNGYWVRSDDRSEVSLISESSPSRLREIDTSNPPGFASIRMKSRSGTSLQFFIGGEISDLESVGLGSQNYSLPPVPPSSAFDIRMEGNSRLAPGNDVQFNLQSPGARLKVVFDENGQFPNGMIILTLLNAEGETVGEYEVTSGESEELLTEGISSIKTKLITGTSIYQVTNDLPEAVKLRQNFPNPFNPTTVIQFEIPAIHASDAVVLTVYDVLGRSVATLVDGTFSAGVHSVNFDASQIGSGIYVYRLEVGGIQITRTMTLVK